MRVCRTFDPEEADFFYVPQYSSCMPFPIMGWADYPWFGPPGSGGWWRMGAPQAQVQLGFKVPVWDSCTTTCCTTAQRPSWHTPDSSGGG